MSAKTPAEDAALINASLELAAERGGDLTEAIYARLFRERPEFEPLFVMDRDGAVRGEMLARAFDTLFDFIGERSYAHHMISAEASNHDAYNVPRASFSRFFAIISETVRDACGADWSIETAAAWRNLLADLDRFVGA